MTAAAGAPPGYGPRRILAIALPVVLSNATLPLQGAIDVAIIGRLGSETLLAAVGLGAAMYALLFGLFNFLQLSSSGLSAQALGARDAARVMNTLARALVVALAIAAALIVARGPLIALGAAFFQGSAEAEALAGVYIGWRVWGAPAELGVMALMGWFAGQEMTRRLLQLQLVQSISNIALNVLFVLGLGMDVAGVAIGTALAAWLALGVGLWLARRRAAALAPDWRPEPARILRRAELLRLMSLSRDIFVRSLLLQLAFAWMVRLGSAQGDATLAANVVLMTFFEVTAYALDGFAIAAETLVGQAVGARDPRGMRRAAVATSVWCGGLAALLAALLLLGSGPLVDLLTTSEEVRALARTYAPWAALTPLVGFAAFQLDGIFVGAAAGAQMRNAMLAAAAVYFPGAWLAAGAAGNHGVWAALHVFLIARAAAMLALYPGVERAAGRA